MTKLYNQIPIETWKKIAYKVQRLKISDCSDQEFKTNLNMLKKLLSGLYICLEEGNRMPEREQEIGLATLLHSILFSKNIPHRYRKANFYEYIHRLSDLGIKSMEFRPVDFYYSVDELYFNKNYEEKIISKCYTDGNFKFKYFQDRLGVLNYSMEDFQDESYLLDIDLKQYYHYKSIFIMKAEACVKNFNVARFPSKDEIMKFGFPKLRFSSEVVNWGHNPSCKQEFETFDDSTLSCSKRLTKTPKGVYYYKEYKNK